MKCNLKNRDRIISGYIAGALSDSEAAAFEEHFFSCEICLNELKAAEEAVNLIKLEGPSVLPGAVHSEKQKSFSFFSSKSKMYWGVASVAAAILIFSLLIFLPDKRTNDITISDKQTTIDTSVYLSGADPAKENEITGNANVETETRSSEIASFEGPEFKPSAYMEEWISENLRAGNEDIDTVFSPQNGSRFISQPVLFSWSGNAGILRIMNNAEKEILKTTVSPRKDGTYSIKINPDKLKKPGLYYWLIENENEVVYAGKFCILGLTQK
jgi:hypothetical protein